MSQTSQTPAPQRISDLKVSGHLMTLQTGLFCVFHAPGQQPPTSVGLPGVRISQPPVRDEGNISIVTFDEDGWLGGQNGAALIRVQQGPAQVLVTVYQELGSPHDAPRLQVVQLSHNANAGPVAQPMAATPAVQAPAQAKAPVQNTPVEVESSPYAAEIGAHIQRRGDVMSRVGEWMGEPGSHAWIEGFGIAPTEMIGADDIEYQAVLGKGWLSPWVEGGKYCGSRGMALPILGLCIRLKGKAASKFICRVTATFTDGTRVGPVDTGEPIETASLAPLEAFLVEILTREDGGRGKGKNQRSGKGRNAAAEAEAAADLAALLEEEIAEAEILEDLEELEAEAEAGEEFEVFVEERPTAKGNRKPRGNLAAAKGRATKAVAATPAPAKAAGRPRKAVAEAKAAPTKAQPAGRGRGRKPSSRR
ncbi:hypothetical protein [Acetobacter orleanensis]|uniref:Clostridial hydrophobic W n=1 Tax=Acetobacter orleanensis TaxID=104099 RepID=A0A4Y3TNX5_9PROT|nr:hypothetical protein [Acetobacter orleanensis]KXV62746.1 hypothetical protein AD949_09840 [Acetobacter orleanensis]PCD79266.1 hypothetical protein CO710_08340 [Acetobacter orleanensis]GAN67879.1 hypothetical protein Abol_012_028 [Acetobacter orleanensis JCM 7639]GBR24157.1 hypothetical protein AA0473_0564 [Acetobacter orleanensis NRIC 0473]GEB83443.1 hypothetical protein AOR01nite_19200 [Acetobacter orleanensis]